MSQFKTDSMEGLQLLYIEELRDLYSAENQIVQALTTMASSASRPELLQAFEMHQQQSLERIFESLGQSPNGKVCKGIYGIIGEGKEAIKTKSKGAVLDAALIAGAQSVEHYEIAGYGTVRTWANLLGREQDVALLQQSLDEEGETDKKLTKLAKSLVNQEAAVS